MGVSPGCEVRPIFAHLRQGGRRRRVFVAVPVILGGCLSVQGAEDRAILYICSKVVCVLVSRPVVRPRC